MKNWKKQTGVWIDASEAIIVTLFDGGENVTEIKSGIENIIYQDDKINKVTHRHQFEQQNNNQFDHFISDVMSQVKESDELFIFGPSETKTKLQRKIYDEHFIDYRKLIDVQTTTKMTPTEILASVREFYKN